MKKIIFLLPPSEWKNTKNRFKKQELSFNFEKPSIIAENVSEKDLKCKWKRFIEWLTLNKNIKNVDTIESINRYSWVMYNAIDYKWMDENWKSFFEEKFLILSWMYWIIKPKDKIWNYKLPIETKWLYDFWGTNILEELNSLEVDFVVNLLPISYSKLIFWSNKKQEKEFNLKRKFKIININFLKPDWTKISHWVKKIKWIFIKVTCENLETNYTNFGWEVLEKGNIIDINIVENVNRVL